MLARLPLPPEDCEKVKRRLQRCGRASWLLFGSLFCILQEGERTGKKGAFGLLLIEFPEQFRCLLGSYAGSTCVYIVRDFWYLRL